MPTRIRLQRKGKKNQPFYHVVVADGRAPRDGKFIEKLGTYNPMTSPASIDLDFDRALYWVKVGAQPSETVRSILSTQGVMMKYHLIKGIDKGALTMEQVEEKFAAWLKGKADKIEAEKKNKDLSKKDLNKLRLEEERKVNEARAQDLAKKKAKELAGDQAEEAAPEVSEDATEAAEETQE